MTTKKTARRPRRSAEKSFVATEQKPWMQRTQRERQREAMANMERLRPLMRKFGRMTLRPGEEHEFCVALREEDKVHREYDMWGRQLAAEVRALAREQRTALLAEVEAEEGTPARDVLARRSRALHSDFERLSTEVWAMPVQRWVDVEVRALICDYNVFPIADGKLEELDDDRGTSRALAELMVSALRMGAYPATTITSVHGYRL